MKLTPTSLKINAYHLWFLGGKIEQKEGIAPISIIPSMELSTEFSDITIQAEYWMDWLIKIMNKKDSSLYDLDWLMDAAKSLRFRGKDELKNKIQHVLTLWEDPNIKPYFLKTNIKTYIKFILTDNKSTPWVIYENKKCEENQVGEEGSYKLYEDNLYDSNFNKNELNSIDTNSFLYDKTEGKNQLLVKLFYATIKNFKNTSKRLIVEILKNFKGNLLEIQSVTEQLLSPTSSESISRFHTQAENIRKLNKVLGAIRKKNLIETILDSKIVKIYGNSGTGLAAYDLIEAGKLLLAPQGTNKDKRDATANIILIGTELLTQMKLASQSWYVSVPAGFAWSTGSLVWNGISELYETWDRNLSWSERYFTYSYAFLGKSTPEKLQEYYNHHDGINALAIEYDTLLKKNDNILFIASGIGQPNDPPSFQEFILKTYGKETLDEVNKVLSHPNSPDKQREIINTYKKEYKDTYPSINNLFPAPMSIYNLDDPNNTLYYIEGNITERSRLTPKLPSQETKILGAPIPKKDDPKSTITYATNQFYCRDAFVLGRDRQQDTSESLVGIFDARLGKSGEVILGNKKVNFKSEFYLGYNSTILISGARNNSPSNRFITSDAFSGTLIGDPLYGSGRSQTESFIDAFAVNETTTIELQDMQMIMRETHTGREKSKAKFNYIQGFLGHSGQDIIDCKKNNILYVAAKGGKPDARDYLTDCKQASLSSHTTVRNNEPGKASYTIQADSTDIELSLSQEKKQRISIQFLNVTVPFREYQFLVDIQAKSLLVKKTDITNYILKINNFDFETTEVRFFDQNGTEIKPHFNFDVNKPEKEIFKSIATKFTCIAVVNSEDDALNSHSHLIYANKLNIRGEYFYTTLNRVNRAYLGSRHDDVIDNLDDVAYTAGFEGVDIYKIPKHKSGFDFLLINNLAQSPLEVDELHLPTPISDAVVHQAISNLIIKSSKNNHKHIILKNYFEPQDNNRHICIVDKDNQAFIPKQLYNSKDIDNPYSIELIHYYSTSKIDRFPEIKIETNTSTVRVAVEGNLPEIFKVEETSDRFILYGFLNPDELIPNLVINFSKENVNPDIEVELYATHEADIIRHASIPTKLKLSDLERMQDKQLMLQEKLDKAINYTEIKLGELRFDDSEKITINPALTQGGLHYAKIDKASAAFKFERDGKDLLIHLFNEKKQRSTLILPEWDKNRLQGFIIDGKLVPIDFTKLSLDDSSLKTTEIRFNNYVTILWLKDQIALKPARLNLEALARISAKQHKKFHSPENNFFELIDIDDKAFINSLSERDFVSEENFSIEETKQINEIIGAYYAIFVLKSDKLNYNQGSHELVSKDIHTLIFKDYKNINDDVLTANKQFKNNIFHNYISAKIAWNMGTIIKTTKYTYKLKTLIDRKTTKHNFINSDSNEYELSFIEIEGFPFHIELQPKDDYLSLIVYDDQFASGSIEIHENELQYLEGIFIEDKLIPISLHTHFLTLGSIEAASYQLGVERLKLYLDDELASITTVAREAALFTTLVFIEKWKGFSVISHLYSVLGYDSAEKLNYFFTNYDVTNINKLTEDEQKETAKAYILYKSKIILAAANSKQSASEQSASDTDSHLLAKIVKGNSYTLTDLKNFTDALFNSNAIKKAERVINEPKIDYYDVEMEKSDFFKDRNEFIIKDDPDNKKLRKLSFDKAPSDIDLTSDNGQDLLIHAKNEKSETGIIRIKPNNSSFLLQINIAGSTLPNSLEYIDIKDPNSLKRHTTRFKFHIAESVLKNQLAKLPDSSKDAARYMIMKFIDHKVPLYSFRLHAELGFPSLVKFDGFYISYQLNPEIIDKKETKEALLLYLVALGVRDSQLGNFVPRLSWIFDNFRSNIKNHFSRIIREFENILSYQDLIEEINDTIAGELNKNLDIRLPAREKRVDTKNNIANKEEYSLVNITPSSTEQVIYHNQIEQGETWITVPKNHRKKLVFNLELSELTKQAVINFSSAVENNDIIYSVAFVRKKHLKLRLKNCNVLENRLSEVRVNGTLAYDNLEVLPPEEHTVLDEKINALILKNWVKEKQQFISGLYLFKLFLISRALVQPLPSIDLNALATSLDFSSAEEMLKSYNDYVLREENIAVLLNRDINFNYEFYLLAYLTVSNAILSNLTDKQIQSLFPFLTDTLLSDFIQCHRSSFSSCSIANETLSSYSLSFSSLFDAIKILAKKEIDSDNSGTAPFTVKTIKIPKKKPRKPYEVSTQDVGFREKISFDFAEIDYEHVKLAKLINKKNVLQVIVSKGDDRKVKKMVNIFYDPLKPSNLSRYSIKDTRKGWEFELPRVWDSKDSEALRSMQQDIYQTLEDAKKTQSIENLNEPILDANVQPLISANQMNVHSIEMRESLEKSANRSETLEEERSWLESAGDWVYKVAVGTVGAVGLSGVGLGAWLCRRRIGMKGSYIAVSTVEKVLEGVTTEATPVEIPLSGTEAYSSNKDNRLLSVDNTEGEELNKTSSRSTDFSGLGFSAQENLILADFFVRKATGAKYGSYIGNYSLERQQTDYLKDLENKIMPLFNMTEKEWSSRYSAFEGEDYFKTVDDDEDDTLFSIRNLFAQENDWSIKTKPQKKTMKSYTEERVA